MLLSQYILLYPDKNMSSIAVEKPTNCFLYGLILLSIKRERIGFILTDIRFRLGDYLALGEKCSAA